MGRAQVWDSRTSVVVLTLFLFSPVPVPVVAVEPHIQSEDAPLFTGQHQPLGRALGTSQAVTIVWWVCWGNTVSSWQDPAATEQLK